MADIELLKQTLADQQALFDDQQALLNQQEGQLSDLATQIGALNQLGLARNGNSDFDALDAQRGALEDQVAESRSRLGETEEEMRGTTDEILASGQVESIVAQLDGNYPIMMLPVRTETRFMTVDETLEPTTISAQIDKVITDLSYVDGVVHLFYPPIYSDPRDIEERQLELMTYLSSTLLAMQSIVEITPTARQVVWRLHGALANSLETLTAQVNEDVELAAETRQAILTTYEFVAEHMAPMADKLRAADLYQVPDHLIEGRPGEEAFDQAKTDHFEYLQSMLGEAQGKEGFTLGELERVQGELEARQGEGGESQAVLDALQAEIDAVNSEALQLRSQANEAAQNTQSVRDEAMSRMAEAGNVRSEAESINAAWQEAIANEDPEAESFQAQYEELDAFASSLEQEGASMMAEAHSLTAEAMQLSAAADEQEAYVLTLQSEFDERNAEVQPPDEETLELGHELDKYGADLVWWRKQIELYGGLMDLPLFTVTSHELWVRIFPDDISVETHERLLTAAENEAGNAYWAELWPYFGTSDFDEKQLGAWRAIVNRFNSYRAAWIVKETEPTGTPGVGNHTPLTVPQKADSWTQQPKAKVLPDQFVVTLYDDTSLVEHLNVPQDMDQNGLVDQNEADHVPGMGTTSAEFTAQYRAIGKPLPVGGIAIGINPSGGPDNQLEHDAQGNLIFDPQIQWMFDFEAAIQKGMAVRVALSEDRVNSTTGDGGGFDRLTVLGVRASSSTSHSAALIKQLFEGHHYGRHGMEFLELGTPTNNTEDAKAGYSAFGRTAEASQGVEVGPDLINPSSTGMHQSNGLRLAKALGIHHTVFNHVQGADLTEQREAIRVNRALWPATMGAFLEDQLGLVLPMEIVEDTRNFFTEYVTGRGPLGSIRVGAQPYGIMPVSAFSRISWADDSFEHALTSLLTGLDANFEHIRRAFVKTVYDPAKVEDYPDLPTGAGPLKAGQQQFLNILGLLAHSDQLKQRYATAVQTTNWSFGDAYAPPPYSVQLQTAINTFLTSIFPGSYHDYVSDITSLLNINFGEPLLLSANFLQTTKPIYGPVVDDLPLSNTRNMADWGGQNYIDSLLNAHVPELRYHNYDGCLAEPPPYLLYHMLRQSLLLSYWDASMKVVTNHYSLTGGDAENLRKYYNNNPKFSVSGVVGNHLVDFFGLSSADETLAKHLTRWDYLEWPVMDPSAPTASGHSLGRYVSTPSNWSGPEFTRLQEVTSAMTALKSMPTRKLHRAFQEHIDLCSYRLDAWWTGLATKRLEEMRATNASGLFIGAYGWVEDLRPGGTRAAADTNPTHFTPGKTGALETDADNQGFIHAPSVAHANTAAILRSGYYANAISVSDTDANRLAINLSSERVRNAMKFIGGIRNGQRLSALLGYQLERGLHERYTGLLELDLYIYSLRKAFPLVADQLIDSSSAPIESVEARNVVDGLALLEAARTTGYPYGLVESATPEQGKLPTVGSNEGQAIAAEVARMADALDAVADLAMAESVYQVTMGNFARASAVINAIMEGNNPPTPEILETPRPGRQLTHRVVALMDDTSLPFGWTTLTARAKAEPTLNRWLADLIGAPENIRCLVDVDETGFDTKDIPLAQLGIQPIDLIYMLGEQLVDDASELAQRIGHEVLGMVGVPQNAKISIRFKDRASNWGSEVKSFFELAPLVTSLSSMVASARAVSQKDVIVPGSATDDANPHGFDLTELQTRVHTAYADLEALGVQLEAQVGTGNILDPALTRTILLAISEFGIGQTIPTSAQGATPEAVAALDRAGDQVLGVINKRLAAADELLNATITGATTFKEVERYQKVAQALFGRSFRILPMFSLETAGANNQAAMEYALTNSGDLLTHADPFAMDDWLHGVSRVRERMHELETVSMLTQTFQHTVPALKPMQLPFIAGEPWVGIEFPSATGVTRIEGDRMSIVAHAPSGFTFTTASAGLMLDEWNELIPDENIDSGIAFFYDQPDSEAPQSVLLAINPTIGDNWSWTNLEATLMETLSLAQKRAVEPDHLMKTFFAQALPGVVSGLRYNGQPAIDIDYAVANTSAENPHPTMYPPEQHPETGGGARPGCGTPTSDDIGDQQG